MDEFNFINSIKQRTYRQPTIVKGINDDAAVFRQSYMDTVTAVDTFVEEVHFSRQTMSNEDIGYRVLAANISDMAAMGAIPAYYMISIVIPNHWTESDLQSIYQGMNKLASLHQMDLIGGDTVSGDQLIISVTIIGFVEKNKARYRSVMKDKDILFATGTLGDSSAGLHLLLNREKEVANGDYLIYRHQHPTPRVAFARAIQSLERAALNDVSDGIANEANELAEASHLTAYIDFEQLPKHEGLDQFSDVEQRKFILAGGEDFELIGAVAEKDWEKVQQAGEATNTAVTKVGYVIDNEQTNGKAFLIEDGVAARLPKEGYTHRSK
ncbi:thiamine-phosphate kinase [Paraliobacillus ryukyuensis]|uniref:thiamine-phosphate kinase n=1 Tax=Paraliobacillus ryukyuensis TaxID=200904 RepID=UPI0009A58DA9|nr:thiamine-phosphate kinase [Paraliobacillus ryukyuensis]